MPYLGTVTCIFYVLHNVLFRILCNDESFLQSKSGLGARRLPGGGHTRPVGNRALCIRDKDCRDETGDRCADLTFAGELLIDFRIFLLCSIAQVYHCLVGTVQS